MRHFSLLHFLAFVIFLFAIMLPKTLKIKKWGNCVLIFINIASKVVNADLETLIYNLKSGEMKPTNRKTNFFLHSVAKDSFL